MILFTPKGLILMSIPIIRSLWVSLLLTKISWPSHCNLSRWSRYRSWNFEKVFLQSSSKLIDLNSWRNLVDRIWVSWVFMKIDCDKIMILFSVMNEVFGMIWCFWSNWTMMMSWSWKTFFTYRVVILDNNCVLKRYCEARVTKISLINQLKILLADFIILI